MDALNYRGRTDMDNERVASELVKVAKALVAGDSLLELVIPKRDLYSLKRDVDEQTWELAREVYVELMEALELTPAQQQALNRLRQSVDGNLSEEANRNNIFKAAHALGIRLPSSLF